MPRTYSNTPEPRYVEKAKTVDGGGGGGMNIIEPIKTGEPETGFLSAAYFDCGEVILVDNIPYISAENANALFTWLKGLSMGTVFTFDFPDVNLFAGNHFNAWLSHKEDMAARTEPYEISGAVSFISGLFPQYNSFSNIGFGFVGGFTGDNHVYFGIRIGYK